MAEHPTSRMTNAHTPTFGLSPGPIPEVHAFWLAGMSCDGCSIAAVGAQSPSVEQLVSGSIPGLPKVILHHPVLAVEAGEAFIAPYRMAREGKLGAPYVVIYEGSVADERIVVQPLRGRDRPVVAIAAVVGAHRRPVTAVVRGDALVGHRAFVDYDIGRAELAFAGHPVRRDEGDRKSVV